jgi:hypothetical protein
MPIIQAGYPNRKNHTKLMFCSQGDPVSFNKVRLENKTMTGIVRRFVMKKVLKESSSNFCLRKAPKNGVINTASREKLSQYSYSKFLFKVIDSGIKVSSIGQIRSSHLYFTI